MHDSTLNNCQACGAPLDPDNPEPLCPGCVFADALAPVPDSPAPGTIGGHLILDEIARGGMGVVYLAKQNDPERLVALKTLRTSALSSPEALRRFRQEVRAMASLDHPAILPVHQFGEQDGVPYFTMRLATGGTLEKRLPRFAGQWKDIAQLMATVADAVQHAHSHTLLHRDLKPANILFDEEDRPYVADFGIAKLLDDTDSADGSLTRTSAVLGTPNYLSPEVAAKDARNATTASDVWSLGVILYQLLAQKLPFQGDFIPEVLTAILSKEPPAIAAAPRDLAVIALKAMSKEPKRRYATARDMAEDLRLWFEGKPITARATTTIERLNLWAKRSPALAVLSCLAILSGVTAVGALYWAYEAGQRETENVRTANEQSQINLQRAESNKRQAEANLAESRQNLRQALLEQARAGRTANLAGWRNRGLEAIRQAAAIQPGPDLRDEAIAHLAGFDLIETPLPPKDANKKETNPKDLPPPGTIFAKPSGQTTVDIIRSPDEKIGTISGLSGCYQKKYHASPDGNWVVQVVGYSGGVWLLDTRKLTVVRHWEDHYFVGFSKSSTQLLLAEENNREDEKRLGDWKRLLALNLPGLEEAQGIEGRLADNGKDEGISRFVRSWSFRSVQFWDYSDVSQTRPFEVTLDSSPMIFADRDDWHVIGTTLGTIYLCRVHQHQVFPLVFHRARVRDARLSEDGLFLTTCDEANTIALWQTDTQALLTRFIGNRVGRMQVYSRGWDSWIEKTGEGLRHLEFSNSQVLRVISEYFDEESFGFLDSNLDLSPDGRWLCVPGTDQLNIYEVATGRLVFTGAVNSAKCAYFSADSRHLWLQETGNKVSLGGQGKSNGGTFLLSLSIEDGQFRVRRTRKLHPQNLDHYGVMDMSANRRWLCLPDTKESIKILDCSHLSPEPSWQTISNTGGAKRSFVSSDGRWLLAQGDVSKGELERWDLSLPQSPPLILSVDSLSPKFSPDSRWLLAGDKKSRETAVYDTATWTRTGRKLPIKPKDWTGNEEWSKDGGMIASLMTNGKIRLIKAGTWEEIATLDAPISQTSRLVFSSDGTQLAVRQEEGGILLWNLAALARETAKLGLPLDLPPLKSPAPFPPELSGPVQGITPVSRSPAIPEAE